MKRTLAVSATALLAAVMLAVPASASLPAPDSVRGGHNISVFHNSDFVGVFGYPLGEKLTVDVYRGPHRIATAFGPAVSTPEGGGLEINHGPAGTAAQGDCWEGHTPDILPGDRIMVTDSRGTDTVLVDDIAFAGAPEEDLSTTVDKWDIVVEGHASYANGAPIPIKDLSSEVRQDVPRYLARPNEIERVGTDDEWKATYTYPYNKIKNKEGLNATEEKQAILTGNHEMGFGHAGPPLPPETQLAESGATGGPALGCEQAPREANTITTSDDEAVNLKSGKLTLGGTAMADTTAVSVTLSDGNPAADVKVDTTDLSTNPGEKGWSVTFSRQQLETLSDGTLKATGAYTQADRSSMTGATMSLSKDLIAPKLSATPEPKTANGPLSVALSVDGGERVRYTTDGSLPNDFSKVYRGVPIELTRTSTIRAFATDAAGNRTDSSFEYVIRQPSTVSLNLSTTTLKPDRSITFSGAVRPAHTRNVVTLTIKRNGSQILETERELNNSSDYSFRYTPKRVGSYSVKVRFAGDADSLADTSSTKRFQVNR